MDKKTLEEYQDEEVERVVHLTNEIFDKKHAQKQISILDFYPEIKERVKDETYTNPLSSSNFMVQLPFFHKLIFPIPPVTKPEWFKDRSVSIEQILELEEKGKIIPVLTLYPTYYANLDYLDQILEKKPPNLDFRAMMFDTFLSASRGIDLPSQAELWDIEGREAFRVKPPPREASEIMSSPSISESVSAEEYAATAYVHLRSAGYDELAEFLLYHQNRELAFFGLHLYRHLLYWVPKRSMDGVQSYDVDLARSAGLDVQAFPLDVGKLLIKELRLIDFRKIGWAEILDICKETEKARKALLELDKAVGERKAEKAVDRTKALEDIWRDTAETIKSVITWKERFKNFITIGCGVIGGLLGSVSELKPILGHLIGGIGGGIVSTSIAEPTADYLVKLRKPSHVVATYDLI